MLPLSVNSRITPALLKRRIRPYFLFCLASSKSEPPSDSDEKTNFGYEEIPFSKKAGRVKDVFSSVAEDYDIMNDIMSAGMHRFWKDDFIDGLRIEDIPLVGPKNGERLRILDVAGGTGDIAFRILSKLSSRLNSVEENVDEGGRPVHPLITVSDINPDMLSVGQKQVSELFAADVAREMEWIQADAEDLPFPDNSFHLYTISFGLRNVTRPEVALREALRVLKPDGRFACLEFTLMQDALPPLQSIYDWYSFNVIPRVGEIVAGDAGAYQYLVESIRKFPTQVELKYMMEKEGFQHIEIENFALGAVASHVGSKPLLASL